MCCDNCEAICDCEGCKIPIPDGSANTEATGTSAAEHRTEVTQRDNAKVQQQVLSSVLNQYFEAVNNELKTPTMAMIHTGLCPQLAKDIACKAGQLKTAQVIKKEYPFLADGYISQIEAIIQAMSEM